MKPPSNPTPPKTTGKHKTRLPSMVYRSRKPIHIAFKPGRNDACPCESGLKYKKCCGHKESLKIQREFERMYTEMDEE
jgi:hypothetical protein